MLDAQIVKRRRNFRLEVKLACPTGEALAVLGASGAGKSTLLACLAGLESPDSGWVRWHRAVYYPPPLALARRQLGWLAQRERLFPHLDVAGNVLFSLGRGERRAAAGWIEELRERLELQPIWCAPADEVSGGEARRVALARLLARRPPLLLLDELFANQDAARATAIAAALNEWRRRWGWTLILAGHRSQSLRQLSERVLLLEQGQIAAQGGWSDPGIARALSAHSAAAAGLEDCIR